MSETGIEGYIDIPERDPESSFVYKLVVWAAILSYGFIVWMGW